jgi:hypothetical protein
VTVRASRGREWRQFQLLSRNSIRRLLDTVLFSQDTDPAQFAVWATALATTPPLVFAVQQMYMYAALRRAPAEVVERIVLGHRLFFIVYAMLAAVLLAALIWDALFPDRGDQETMGVLPVRPRTVVAARLAAGCTIAVAFAVAISLPSGIVYVFISGSIRSLTSLPGNVAGHVLATILGCLFVFFTLLSIRGGIVLCGGTRATGWLGTTLQLVTIVLLVEVFLFLPGVLPALVRQMLDSGPFLVAFPPVWFAALYSTIAGDGNAALAPYARAALLAAAGAAATVGPMYLLPAARVGRRTLEARERKWVHPRTWPVGIVARLAAQPPPVRAMLAFAAVSLARSRRHRLILATYLGLALATIIVSIGARGPANLSFDRPAAYLLAVPLALMFFFVLGLRASMRVPVDVDANWPFRLSPPDLRAVQHATRAFLATFGVVPVLSMTVIVTVTLWPLEQALAIFLFDVAAGVLLVELAVHGWAQIPFASAHAASTETVKWKWALYALALNLFAFAQARLQVLALASLAGVTTYLLLATVCIAAARAWRHRRLRRDTLLFDAVPEGGHQMLNLSEAG